MKARTLHKASANQFTTYTMRPIILAYAMS